jgi:hypothetical protein
MRGDGNHDDRHDDDCHDDDRHHDNEQVWFYYIEYEITDLRFKICLELYR